MKFGLFILGDHRDPSVSHKERLDQFMEQVELAESLGFDSVWFAEHHFTPYGLVGNTLTMAAAAAVRTERVRIGTGIVIVPFMHPLRLAEEASMVDVLSGGRLDLGLGRGYQPVEFRTLGENMEESQAKFDEALEVLDEAFAGKTFSHHGRHWSFDDVTVQPRPVQEPLPFRIAAASPPTFERLGRQRRRILTSPNFTPSDLVKSLNEKYLSAYAAAGPLDLDDIEIPMLKQVFVHRDPASALSIPREYSLAYFRLLGHLIAEEGEEHKGYEMYSKTKRHLETLTYEKLLADGVVFGTPDEVTEKMVQHWRDLHINYFLAWFDFGGIPREQALSSIELFAREVMPAVRSRAPGVSAATARVAEAGGGRPAERRTEGVAG
ncbi:MAG: LLM class flavin-dependent oxidoreductase [Streptosporangiales bacterium]|nr:LLM class flavin-dependent oxidoreductase [Streptosporangiales bacterium]